VITIRPALPADTPGPAALSRRTINAAYRSFLGNEAVDAYLSGRTVEEYVQHSLERCTVLYDGLVLVGCVVVQDDLIDLMLIDPSCQRRGYGARLLAHLEETLFARHDELRLESFAQNTPANQFYAAAGWSAGEPYFDPPTGVEKVAFRRRAPGATTRL